MPKDDKYHFHQTPPELAKKLIATLPLVEGDILFEPFKGEGAFYNHLPQNTINEWTEIEEGKCYTSYEGEIDWVITNPPFQIVNEKGKRVNAFWNLVEYFAPRVRKGIAFLGNDICFSTLTPNRLKLLKDTYGLSVEGYKVCSVKRWRGRYFFITITKTPNSHIGYIEGNF